MRRSATFLCLTLGLGLCAMGARSEVAGSKDHPAPTMKRTLEDIQKDARKDFQKAADALRALEGAKMEPEDHATWVRLSRQSAIRTGDAKLLKRLGMSEDLFSTIVQAQIIMANGRIEIGDFSGANAELGKIRNLDRINPRERRRYWALKARIAQLTGDEKGEVAALAEIAREMAQWPTAACMSCHNDLKNPTVVQTIDVKKLWFMDRYVELLKKRGEAGKLAEEATKRLAKDPKDIESRLFLYAALTASPTAAAGEVEKTLREISWIGQRPDGEAGPRMIFAWP